METLLRNVESLLRSAEPSARFPIGMATSFSLYIVITSSVESDIAAAAAEVCHDDAGVNGDFQV